MDKRELDGVPTAATFRADDVMDLHYCKRGLPLATSFIGPDEQVEYLKGIVEILKWEIHDVFDALEHARAEAAEWRGIANRQTDRLDRFADGRDHQRAAIARLRSEVLAVDRAMP